MLKGLGIDFIGRTTRGCDGRKRTKKLGKKDWLMTWQCGPQPSSWLTPAQWLGLPATLTVRVVKGRWQQKGCRVQEVAVVTTLLDPVAYPAAEILAAYGRRWRLEMCLDDVNTTLKMEKLRSHTPAMVEKELHTRLIVHNLIRYVMAEAATEAAGALERLSFKGTLDALRHFAQAMAGTRSRKKQRQIWAGLLRMLASDLGPERPGRQEPRAVKRKQTKYPRLNQPRGQFRDAPKRNPRRTNARVRNNNLM